MKNFAFFSLFACFALLAITNSTLGQTCIPFGGSNPGSHTQNFDGLESSPAPQNSDSANINILQSSNPRVYLGKFNNAIADNLATVNVPGWALVEVGSNVNSVTGRYATGDGSNAGSNSYSFGTDTDRAFGSLNDDTMHAVYLGGCFTNTSFGSVNMVQISFTGEMWRRGAAGAQTDTLHFEYAVAATNLYTGSYTPFTALNFVTPNTTGGAGARNGNDPAYRTVFSPTTLNVTIPPGQSLYVRWVDHNIAGSDDGLAIDDFHINFFAPSSAPVQISGRAMTAEGRALPRTQITLQSMTGETRSAITNPFGYYSFAEVSAGETYIITAFAKGQQFAPASRVVDASDSLMNVDFVTAPLLQARPQTSSKTLKKQ